MNEVRRAIGKLLRIPQITHVSLAYGPLTDRDNRQVCVLKPGDIILALAHFKDEIIVVTPEGTIGYVYPHTKFPEVS